jgi:hypothetical protein
MLIPNMDRVRETLAEQFPRMSRLGMAAVFLALSATAFAGQSPSASRPDTTLPAENHEVAMGQFVLLFRPGSRKLSLEEHSQLSLETRAWAKQWIQEGYSLDPRALSQESFWITPDNAGNDARPVTNLLFLTAKDFDDAVRIAKTHPGARYGTEIEVRAWAPPNLTVTPAR